ncbi:DNA polymerase IV [Corynebacterium sp. ES2794-CONJ1]|uniref:DNA polymerase IV n=1 Tax=Corynebacterium sp. ES2794-CONJ1 TaxID=2980553 RepID=UPI0021D821FA|nr:DNA polymerase IV [Corynebacterium sp. ES2794-CONJ1]MCU9518648.1 DNA polymerase IV [Corynebacterium sp. ES2794-CONJ1]
MDKRWVLHIDMDAFFASVEQLTKPTLKGRPVLVGGTSGRGVVAGASYEARAFGAHSAMPMHQAKNLVGYSAVVISPRKNVYSLVSQRVFRIVKNKAGLIEQLSIDEAFLEPENLRGQEAEEVTAWAENLRQAIREETGLTCSIGCGSGKQAAKIGSGLAKPDGVAVINHEDEREILGALPVGKLWGVGPVASRRLKDLGVHTIADFAALEEKEVEIALGRATGLALWEIARGNDNRPVAPRAIAKSVGAEFTYSEDLIAKDDVDQALQRAFRSAHQRLLKDGRGARTVSVKLKMADHHNETRSHSFLYATDDQQLLEKTAELLLRYPQEVGPIRLVGVSFSNLEMPSQEMLFPELLPSKPVASAESDYEVGVRSSTPEISTEVDISSHDNGGWRPTQDISHPDYGHGWIQGCGHGVLTVRFETRATGPGFIKTFSTDDPLLEPADPIASLAWPDNLAEEDF